MSAPAREGGSFRDPRGYVFLHQERVFRYVAPGAVEDWRAVRAGNTIAGLIERGWLVAEKEVEPAAAGLEQVEPGALVLEHPRLATLSYPYEWCFSALRDAALHHLDVHIACLGAGIQLSDASAYNIQFHQGRPVFIDALSFLPYREGEPWAAHQQFCNQFLNPLLLSAHAGVAFQPWYRGQLEGVPTDALACVLPWRSRFSLQALQHVFLLAAMNRRSTKGRAAATDSARKVRIRRDSLLLMLKGLRDFIAGLKAHSRLVDDTLWRDYAATKSYASDENAHKHQFIRERIGGWHARRVVDLGCNTGEFSLAALDAGAHEVVGLEFDHGAADVAYRIGLAREAAFLPLLGNIANESPAQGWLGRERQSLSSRLHGDCVLALALVHHLAIAANLPLSEVIKWIVARAPRGIIEFVPKGDPRVDDLLALREDLFADYSADRFRSLLQGQARIVAEQRVSDSGRLLFAYERD